MGLLKAVNPFFTVFSFFNATVFLPIVVNGVRVLGLWYSPLADTGQVTFEIPFLIFVLVYALVSGVVGFLVFRMRKGRFILVHGPMRLRTVVRATLRDGFGRALVMTFFPSYFLSYLVVSGLLLIPNVNVSPYFHDLTTITYQAVGFPVFGGLLVFSPVQYLIGLANDVVLTLSLILSYYVTSLLYVSSNALKWAVPKSLRLSTYNTAAGFLTASIPSLGTIAGVCCLTPTAVNSLLYLLSGAYPAVTKGITWKYGTFMAGAWTGGILQALILFSPSLLGLVMLGLGVWQVSVISSLLVRRAVSIENSKPIQ